VASFDFRAKIGVLRLRLQRLTQELGAREERLLRVKRERWERLTLQLHERSPLKVLERGYAIATNAAGKVLRDTTQVQIGDAVTLQLHRGRLISEIRKKE
jgi:exodeoxyribonuclease VII large subunit